MRRPLSARATRVPLLCTRICYAQTTRRSLCVIVRSEEQTRSARSGLRVAMGSDPPGDLPDPFALVSSQLRPLDGSLRELVGSDNPVLTRVAQHFFELQGKRFRPTVVLLASAAANGGSPANTRQGRLAEITEMIHAASLLHDDVIDLADSRRGARAAHRIYGNKVAVLAGDFLLARASVLLSRLRDVRVVELLATTIEEMVHGELMQVKASPQELLDFEHYLSKTYRKTAALISLSCQASAMLGGHPPRVELALQGYGRHLGIAYQLVDDILDCTGSVGTLGKPALSDMQQGLATAPTLFAAEEFPQADDSSRAPHPPAAPALSRAPFLSFPNTHPLAASRRHGLQVAKIVQRRFSKEGDAAAVSEFVARSGGLQRARELASSHAQQARTARD